MTSKEDPVGMTPMREAAIQAHELYMAFRESGFSRREAMELVAKIISNVMMTAVDDNEPKSNG
jgi:hypothetical protein